MEYTRPLVDEPTQREARVLAAQLTVGKRPIDIRNAIAGLLCENQRLVLEVNEHRAARGYELLPTVEQK